jgi:ribosomal protein S18 acetylase RimI-like enzyme
MGTAMNATGAASGRKFKTRFANQSDLPALEKLVHEAYRAGKASVAWKNEHDVVAHPRATRQDLQAMLADAEAQIIIAESDDTEKRLIGSVLIERSSPERSMIGMLAVDPEWQNVGLGKHLVRVGEEHAATAFGSTIACMCVYNTRTGLLEWYKRLGYEPTGQVEELPDDFKPLVDDLTFVRIEHVL